MGRDCTNNNGLILKMMVLLFYVIIGDLHHTVFVGFRYLRVYIKVFLYIHRPSKSKQDLKIKKETIHAPVM